MADGKKARGDNSVSFNDLRQRENQQESRPPAAAQRSLTSGSATHQGAGAVYAVVNKPTRGKGGKASRVAPPVYAAVNKATGASNSTPTVRASSDQAYALAPNDNPPPYELAMACGPDMKATAASLTAAQGTPQTAEDPTDYDVLGQTRGSTKAGRDVTYGHLGEVVGDDDVDYGYDHTGTQSTGGVINSVYDTARAPSDGHGDLGDDDTADGAYDTTKLGQGQRRDVVGSDYDKMDQTYVNSAFSMQPRK